jgi:hypothetical protein
MSEIQHARTELRKRALNFWQLVNLEGADNAEFKCYEKYFIDGLARSTQSNHHLKNHCSR